MSFFCVWQTLEPFPLSPLRHVRVCVADGPAAQAVDEDHAYKRWNKWVFIMKSRTLNEFKTCFHQEAADWWLTGVWTTHMWINYRLETSLFLSVSTENLKDTIKREAVVLIGLSVSESNKVSSDDRLWRSVLLGLTRHCQNLHFHQNRAVCFLLDPICAALMKKSSLTMWLR